MAPSNLLGHYKLYKAGTKKVVQWLAETGARCCDLKSIIKSLGKGAKASGKGGNTTFINIRTQELVKLAEVIATSDPPMEIPDTIVYVLEDVIAGRKECAEWYGAQALQDGSSLEAENESHRHFTTVLQSVRNLLESARVKTARPDSFGETSDSQLKKSRGTENDELSNLFLRLEVEQPPSAPLGDNPPASLPTPVAEFKLEKEDDDLAFATWCFLQDLGDVRMYLRQTWLEYSRGGISFLAASSLTDTAFGLLRSTDHDFTESTSQSLICLSY